VTSTRTDARRREDRWFGVAFYGVLAAGQGSNVTRDFSDSWSTAARLLAATVCLILVIRELTIQAQRRQISAPIRWSRSDTVNVSVMVGYAVLLCAAVTLGSPPWHEKTSGAAFAALYLALGAYFWWLRRRTLVQQQSTATDGAEPDRVAPVETAQPCTGPHQV
jgi:hypothetical protein